MIIIGIHFFVTAIFDLYVVSSKAACGIIFGSGVTPEIDMEDIHTNEEEQAEEEEMSANSDVGVRQDTLKIMELLRQWEMNEPEDQVWVFSGVFMG